MGMRCVLAVVLLVGCGSESEPEPQSESQTESGSEAEPAETPEPAMEPPAYTLVIHGGAGAMPRDLEASRREAYVASLAAALRLGCAALEEGEASLDVVQSVVVALEDDPLFNAGKGAVMTREGRHELDASLMRGADHACGAVAGVSTVRNPIQLARAVMEHTPHVLLAGEGAEAFAVTRGMEPVPNTYFTTERRREQWERRRDAEHGTVGAVALDREGHLAAGTSTGGLTNKRWGRIGDSPIVGAGTYADDATCAVSCTGTGEEFIRHGVARAISARMELAGESVSEAARHLIEDTLQPGDGGVIALSHTGEVAMVYSTGGMFRGTCGPDGVEVRIWEDTEPPPARE